MKSLLFTILFVVTSHSLFAQIGPSLVSGTQKRNVHGLVVFNNKLVFGADDSIHGIELWSYDGVNPAAMIADLNPSGDGIDLKIYKQSVVAQEHNMVVLNNELYFAGTLGTGVYGLCKWDGSSQPKLVKNISAANLAVLNNKLYFGRNNTAFIQEFWVYDPVPDTAILLSSHSGFAGSYVEDILAFNNKIYYVTDTQWIPQTILFEYNPSTGNISKVNHPNTFMPRLMTIAGSKMYFFTTIGLGADVDLHSYDGTTVQKLTSFNEPNLLGKTKRLVNYNNKLYFWADTSHTGKYRLTSYDLSNGTITVLNNFGNGKSGETFLEYHGKLYTNGEIDGYTTGSNFLFSYDGVNSPKLIDTTIVTPTEAIVFNNNLYFTARPAGSDTTVPLSLYGYNDTANSIQNLSLLNDVVLYPNPANNTATLSFTLKQEQNLSLTITDALGKIVYQKPASTYNSGSNKIEFNVHNFSSGIYHCRLATEQNALVWSGKLVKE